MTDQLTTSGQKQTLSWASICICSIALLILLIGAFRLYDNFKVGYWPIAEGKIVSVEIRQEKVAPNWYEAIVSYQFNVNGKELLGSEIAVIPVRSKYESEITWVKERYPVGSIHSVYYQQTDPNVAYLEYNPKLTDYLLVIGPLLLVGAGFLDFVGFIRRRV